MERIEQSGCNQTAEQILLEMRNYLKRIRQITESIFDNDKRLGFVAASDPKTETYFPELDQFVKKTQEVLRRLKTEK